MEYAIVIWVILGVIGMAFHLLDITSGPYPHLDFMDFAMLAYCVFVGPLSIAAFIIHKRYGE